GADPSSDLGLLCHLSGFTGVALGELDPKKSVELPVLNNLALHPLPSDIDYVSIIGTGTLVLGSDGQDGDGVVTVTSQNLQNVIDSATGEANLRHTTRSLPIEDRACDPTFRIPLIPHETHTCESSDRPVEREVLLQIERAAGSPTPSPTRDHITLSPAGTTITAGGSQTYTAQGFHASNNSLGDVTASTIFSISPDGFCIGATCTASIARPHTVTGNDGGKTATASLSVNPGPLDNPAGLPPFPALP